MSEWRAIKAIQDEIAANGGITATLRNAGMDVGLKGTLSRINRGQHVSEEKLLIIARGLELVAPPYRAYRPCIKPTSLRTVASGKEIAELLAEMERMGVNMDYVLMLLKRADEQGSQFQLVEMIETHEKLMREMEGI